MAVDQGAPAKGAPFAKESIIWERKGPLPVWAWALLVLALVLAITWWRRNRAAADATEVATGSDAELPGNQSAGPIFVVPQSPTPAVNVGPIPVTVTVPAAPPGGGSPPPVTPPVTPTPVPVPPGKYVPVAAWTRKNPPWASTISGIASHFAIRDWRTVWNHPLNADLRRRRGKPELIRSGDQVFVPGVR